MDLPNSGDLEFLTVGFCWTASYTVTHLQYDLFDILLI